MSALPALTKLLRLDLTGNALVSLDGLTAHTALKWLSVASNAVTSIPALHFPELQVGAWFTRVYWHLTRV